MTRSTVSAEEAGQIAALLRAGETYSTIQVKTGRGGAVISRIATENGIHRAPRKSHPRKLTERDILAIREWTPESGISQKALGAKFGISGAMANRIITGAAWRHVPDQAQLDAQEEAARETRRQRFRDQMKLAMKDAGKPLDRVTAEILTGADIEMPSELHLIGTAGRVIISRVPASASPVMDAKQYVRAADAVLALRNGTTPADIQAAIADYLTI